jgi:adenosylcobinamide-GDP ribazoletransferase
MKKQIRIFFTALMFYTRIPCPDWIDHSEEYLNKATVYFPFIGWIVGFMAAITYFIGLQVFDTNSVAVLLSMVATVLLTGAFHEDGFADVCDGFGGGWTKAKILEIMKDSRVGAYGVIGLVLLLGLKYQTLVALLSNFDNSPTWGAIRLADFRAATSGFGGIFLSKITIIFLSQLFLFLAAHSLSRFVALTLIYTHEYVRENEDAKAKPVAKKMTFKELAVAFGFGLIPFLCFVALQQEIIYFLVIFPLWFCRWYLVSYYVKWIGGYTGDCLGAVQQVAEVVFLLTILALTNFTS